MAGCSVKNKMHVDTLELGGYIGVFLLRNNADEFWDHPRRPG